MKTQATWSQKGWRGRRHSRGVAAVEFAIIAPLLLFTMLATAEIGRAFVHFHRLSYATRAATRYLSEHAIDGTTGVVRPSADDVLRTRHLAVFGNADGVGSRVVPNLQLDDVTVSSTANDVQLDIDYTYQPMIGEWLPTFNSDGDILLGFDMHVAVTMRAIS